MKHSSYFDRSLKAKDRRYQRVFEKLGYETRDMTVEPQTAVEPADDGLAALRAEYEVLVGRRPFMGWDSETLREKIAAATAAQE